MTETLSHDRSVASLHTVVTGEFTICILGKLVKLSFKINFSFESGGREQEKRPFRREGWRQDGGAGLCGWQKVVRHERGLKRSCRTEEQRDSPRKLCEYTLDFVGPEQVLRGGGNTAGTAGAEQTECAVSLPEHRSECSLLRGPPCPAGPPSRLLNTHLLHTELKKCSRTRHTYLGPCPATCSPLRISRLSLRLLPASPTMSMPSVANS